VTTDAAATILLVDDDAGTLTLIATILRGEGYTVLTAEDGPSAIAMAEKYPVPIQLLVADVVLPGMNGRDLALRLGATRPEMKVLYISGYIARTAVQEQMIMGSFKEGAHFLAKPFRTDDLLRRVGAVLRGM